MKPFFLYTLYSILTTLYLTGCQPRTLHKDTQLLMGTFIEVTSPHKEAAGIAFAELKRIENLLSKYKAESEIAQLNKTGKLKASPETLSIIKKAKEFSQITGGAFDVTVGPLMDIWGFTDKQYTVPESSKINETLKLIGSDKIMLDEENFMVELKVKGMRIDLGGIAKGYAVDRAVKKLKENGINSCLINAGGQVYGLGDKSGKPWKIAIRDPRGESFIGYLELKDGSVSTSGDYEQYFTRDNKRYAHIINPKSGYPVDTGILSVTIAASDGLTADALSTAVFVLGKEAGEELIAKKIPGAKIVKIIENK